MKTKPTVNLAKPFDTALGLLLTTLTFSIVSVTCVLADIGSRLLLQLSEPIIPYEDVTIMYPFM